MAALSVAVARRAESVVWWEAARGLALAGRWLWWLR